MLLATTVVVKFRLNDRGDVYWVQNATAAPFPPSMPHFPTSGRNRRRKYKCLLCALASPGLAPLGRVSFGCAGGGVVVRPAPGGCSGSQQRSTTSH
jgi:hypothetical protein